MNVQKKTNNQTIFPARDYLHTIDIKADIEVIKPILQPNN